MVNQLIFVRSEGVIVALMVLAPLLVCSGGVLVALETFATSSAADMALLGLAHDQVRTVF